MAKKKTSRPKPARQSRRSVPAANASPAAPSAPPAGSSAQAPRSELLDRLDESGIRPSEVARVMESFFEIFGFHQHDLSNCMGPVQGFLTLISLYRESEKEEGNGENKEWGGDELGEMVATMSGAAAEAARCSAFYTFRRSEGPSFGKLSDVIAQVAGENPALTVSVEPTSSPDLELLYPRILLKVIFNELFQNAVKHGGATIARISWVEIDAMIRIVIEDNGAGFAGIPDDDSECFIGNFTSARHGLSLIWQTVRAFNGMVTAARSSDLGGAKISILFKPKLYWINGRLRKPE